MFDSCHPPFLGNVAACGPEDQQGHEEAQNGERRCECTPVAVLTVGERRVKHIQCQRRRRLSWTATSQRQDGVEHLERPIDAEDERREEDGRQQRQDDVAYEPQPGSTVNFCALENFAGDVDQPGKEQHAVEAHGAPDIHGDDDPER